MITIDLLYEFEQLGVRLWREGDALKFEAPKGVMTPERKNILKQHRFDLLEQLSAGDAQKMIEPLDHSNDEPVLSPKMHRALNGLDYLMNQKRSSLRRISYPESNAMVNREEWRTAVMRALHVYWQDMDVLEDSLYRIGALDYQQGRIYVVRGNGEPKTHTACMDNPNFLLDDDTGRTFTNWLYSWLCLR